MESPGEYLKREREQRGVSLAEIYKVTRVPLKHLKALEADDYDAMPHSTFVKGYIKSYCKVLGVDETDAVLRYEVYLREKAGSAEAAKAEAQPPRPGKVEQPPLLGEFWENKRNLMIAAGGAAVVVIIIIAVFIFGSNGPEQVPMEEQAAQEAPEAAPVKVAPAKVAPAPVKPRQKAPEPAAAKPRKMRHSLEVRAIEAVWIEAAIDGGKPFDVTLKKGERVVWKAARAINLKIGNAGGVALSFNGKRLAPVGEPGYVVRLELPSGRVKVLAKPKPEQEAKPVPAEAGTQNKDEASAPGEAQGPLPAEPSEEGPEIMPPPPAAGTVPEMQTTPPAAGTMPEIEPPVQGIDEAGGDEGTSVPAAPSGEEAGQ